MEDRGLRTSVALYCIRPDLIDGAALEQIGDETGRSRQHVHKLAENFRVSIGLPALAWAGLAFLDSLLPGRSWRAHSHLAKTFTLLPRFDQKAKRRALFSPSDWWKARLLFYLLRKPVWIQPHARTARASQRPRCRGQHEGHPAFLYPKRIRRDERSGRPRKLTKPGAGVSLDPR